MDRSLVSSGILVIVLAVAPTTARAGQSSATMQVILDVQPACQVSATTLAFAGKAGQVIEGNARIDVACNGDIPLLVTLDGGTHSSGGERRLASADGAYVAYALYSDVGRQLPWSAGQPISARLRGGKLELAAYGRIEPGATLSARGQYADTVAVTVDF